MKKKVTFFLIQHTFGCCKPLSSFEYFPKLILTFFFFLHFYGGTGSWSSLL